MVATSETVQGTRAGQAGPPRRKGTRGRLSPVVEGGVWLLLLITPVALGSVSERATALMEGGCFTLFILAWWGGMKREGFDLPAWVRWPAVLFCVWTLLQVVPLPPEVLRFVSPGTHAAYSRFLPGYSPGEAGVDVQGWLLNRRGVPSEALVPRADEHTGLEGDLRVSPGWRPISWYPWETLRWLSRFLAYGAFLLLVTGHLPERSLEKRLPWLVLTLGFGLSLFGIIQNLAWNGKIFWIVPVYQGHPFGPWVNSDHFSGYLEMALALGCGLLLREAGFGARRRKRRGFDRSGVPKVVLCCLMLAIIASALLMAGSRGGLFSLALAICFYAYLQIAPAFPPKIPRAARSALALVPLLLCAAGIVLYIFRGREIYAPESGMELSLAARIRAWSGVLPMIAANPMGGTGLGTFAYAFPLHKTYGEFAIWNQAHNDYLQVLAESGFVGFGLFLWGLAFLWRRGLWPRLSGGWRQQSPVALGACLGLVVLLLHSLVDFNLQTPSNGLLFVLLAALLLAEVPARSKSPEVDAVLGRSPLDADSRKSLTDAALTLQ